MVTQNSGRSLSLSLSREEHEILVQVTFSLLAYVLVQRGVHVLLQTNKYMIVIRFNHDSIILHMHHHQ